MQQDVPYSRQTLETPNPIARFAHRRRFAVTLDLVERLVPPNGSLLDFGCGTGVFLNQLASHRPRLKLFGFDPESGHVGGQYVHTTNVATLPDSSMDAVCCFETLEHLYPREIADFVQQTKRILCESGRLVISVPIIGGPPLLMKELNRMILFRRSTDYSPGELARAALMGRPGKRTEDLRGSHKGFDFRRLQRELSSTFDLVETIYSPTKFLPWFLNSQVFWVFKPKAQARLGRSRESGRQQAHSPES